jgi:putative DNA primase/helicase
LATDYGLTGWQSGRAIEAAERCFRESVKERGTAGPSDLHAAVRQVRAFLEAHGSSRFQFLYGAYGEEQTMIRDRAGFRRYNPESGEMEFLIMPEVFRTEICDGFSHRAVLKELLHRGLLVTSPPDMTIKPRLPEIGLARVYCIRGVILDGNEC